MTKYYVESYKRSDGTKVSGHWVTRKKRVYHSPKGSSAKAKAVRLSHKLRKMSPAQRKAFVKKSMAKRSCGRGYIEKKGYTRKGYTRSSGIKVKKTKVSSTLYKT